MIPNSVFNIKEIYEKNNKNGKSQKEYKNYYKVEKKSVLYQSSCIQNCERKNILQ